MTILPLGRCPRLFITTESSGKDKTPSSSLSKSMNTSLYSATCSFVSFHSCCKWKKSTLKSFDRYKKHFVCQKKRKMSYATQFLSQIREQMSGPKISKYGKSILGCGLWPGLDCGKKGSGPIMSNFWGLFFHFFGVKKKFKFFLKTL